MILAQTPVVLGAYDQTDVSGPIVTDKLYVDSQAGAGGNGTVCAPFNDIALAIAAVNPTRATSINVAGTHTLAVDIPAHGVTIEGYTTPASPNRPRFEALPSGVPMVTVGSEGNTGLPASVIKGIEFRDFPTGGPADVAVFINPGTLTATAAVEVTQCEFENMAIGVLIVVSAGEQVSRHVVHDNDFVWPFEQEFPSANTVAIEVDAAGPSSTLVRANRISNYQWGFICGGGDAAQPRLQSNAIQRATTGALFANADADLRGNTFAFGAPRGTATQVVGVQAIGGSLQLYNSILWNPTTTLPTADVVTSGGTTITQGTNLFFNVPAGFTSPFAPGTQPDFVGGNTVSGVFPPVSLNLLETSTMVDAGVNADTADLTAASPAMLGTAGLSRVDVGLDVDHDPRIYNGTTDVGCDEVMVHVDPTSGGSFPISIAPAVWSGAGPFWDADGNLLADTSGQWSITLDVLGPPNAVVVVFEGWVYMDQLNLGGTLVANADLHEHSLSPFGNVFWNLQPGWHIQQPTSVVATDAAGVGSVTVGYTGLGANNLESCVTLQATMLDQASGLHQSNKVRIEINDACGTGL
ncbi:MAG: hypothetical protein ACE37K_26250 [Planctomycetota bacterium]